jgi:phospholipid-binding lipoprotein MlaA
MADVAKRLVDRWFMFILALAIASPVLAEEPPPHPGPRPMPLPPLAEPAPQPPGVEGDPWESFNRRMFWFNDKLDDYVLEPAAKGWDFVMPNRVETCVSNFFYNLRFPIHTLNDLLQGKVQYAVTDVGRFFVNTTIGLAGFFDPATSLGLEHHWEDFGQTLGWWGVGTGPYLVLPVLGPSDLRDGGGLMVDTAASITPFFVSSYYLVAARTVDLVNTRAVYADAIQKAKDSSLDYYTFVRNAYLQRRASLVNDQAAATEATQEDLYHPEGD